jgi:hypothetical protein
MAFDPDAYLASKQSPQAFDPDAYLQSKGASETPVLGDDASPVKSATTGLIQGSTLGFGDELGAAGDTAMAALSGRIGPLAGGSLDDLIDDYKSSRDKLRAEFARSQAANPKINMAGQLLGTLATGGASSAGQGFGAAVKTGAQMGAVAGLGNSDSDLVTTDPSQYVQALKDTGKGAAFGAAGGAAGYGLGKAVSAVVNPGQYQNGIRNFAEDQAVNATGATGKQASKFSDDAGRELLDRGIVGFGNNASNIADKAESALNQSRGQITNSISALDNEGANLSRDDLVSKLQAQIDQLKTDPSQNQVVKSLENIRDSVTQGPENVSLQAGETTKRGFQDLSNYNDPSATRANKIAADTYRTSVEDAATEANPELANTFKEGKDTYGLIAPIREAAEKRASTLNQSPIGGLGDLTAAGAGFIKAGPVGAVIAPIAKRLVAPRLSSSLAVGADKVADLVAQTPQVFGKWAPALQEAAQRGTQSLAVTHYLLQQNDPDFRKHVQSLYGENQ